MHPPSLLDTDILSELFKGNDSIKTKAAAYIHEHTQLTISQITKYEVLKGLKAKDAQKQIGVFLKFCEHNIVLSITDSAILKAADIYAALKKQGKLISDADILVAAIAITTNLILVTNNIDHFSRIDGLQLDNWKT
ncbi:MAG: type II toxin-antitoxin system VapC family toxin [Nitrospirae bacterium]|nr:type II toxin-antitoxin system VapC family toxin [Nitrospirota bacterium]